MTPMAKIIKGSKAPDPVAPPRISARDRLSSSVKGRVIEGEIYDARLRAKQIIEDAMAEAEKIRASAEEYRKEQGEKGFEKGYQDGLAQATEILLRAREEYARLLHGAEAQMVKLAIKVARKIIGREFKVNPRTILDVVSQAISAVRQQSEIIIRVNPSDLEVLVKNKEKLIGVLGRAKDLDIRGDKSVKRGGCVIDSEIGTIDAQLDTQLAMIEKILLKQ
jgi:type III secretion protein L